MPQVRKEYGRPSKSVKSGGELHFYGRMMLIEVEGGKIHGVARLVVMGTP